MPATEELDGLAPPSAELNNVTELFTESHPHHEGVFGPVQRLYEQARTIGEMTVTHSVEELRKLTHELTHGNYSEKFRAEFKERQRFDTAAGFTMTARVLNPEFLDESNPEADDKAIVYFCSLVVPTCHGAEIPTIAALAAHGEEAGRPVIVFTTEGLCGPLSDEQLSSLTDLWTMPKRRFDVLRQIFPNGKKIMVTGASLGGTMSHAMAKTWQNEALQSGVDIEVTHDFAVASAGHFEYTPKQYPRLVRQALREGKGSMDYVISGDGWKGKIQRSFELLGTVPRHSSQLRAVGAISVGLKKAPLKDVLKNIPYNVDVRDYSFSEDELVHPRRRVVMATSSRHPNVRQEQDKGVHMALLTKGKEWTLRQFESVASKRASVAA